jgi:hypothetical protein
MNNIICEKIFNLKLVIEKVEAKQSKASERAIERAIKKEKKIIQL